MNNSIYIAAQNILKANEPVKFFNTFRGMPVNYSGKILKIIGARVTFNVSSLQINCMVLNHGTYLKSNRINGIVRAKVADYNIERETVDLWGFENLINTIGFRTEVRVETKVPVGGLLSLNNIKRIPVSIFEISVRGLAFFIDLDMFDPEIFVIGHRMSLLYHLPGTPSAAQGTVIYYDVEVRNVMIDRSGKYIRVGVRVFIEKNLENVMINYLAHRQKELLVELKALCESKNV